MFSDIGKKAGVIFWGVIFCFVGISFAQPGHPPVPPSASDIVAKMQKELDLTGEQVKNITPIIESEIKQMQAIMAQKADRDQMKNKMEALHKETETQLSHYLSPEQLAKWKSRMKPPHRGNNPRMGPPPGESDNPGDVLPQSPAD